MISKAIDTFKEMFISWQKSDFNFVEIHVMSHYVDSICRFGAPFEYSANLYEHLHITLMKATYCGAIVMITQGTFLNIINTSKLYKGLLENLKVLMPHMNV